MRDEVCATVRALHPASGAAASAISSVRRDSDAESECVVFSFRLISPAPRLPRAYYKNMALHGEYEPSSSTWVRDHVAKYEKSNGAEGASMGPARVVILTTVGANSGKLRKAPLIRVEHDGVYAVVASASGAPKHPSWYFNLLAHPDVHLQDGSEQLDMVAREVTGDERAQWWARALQSNPQYADYQQKVSRHIPVVLLERRAIS